MLTKSEDYCTNSEYASSLRYDLSMETVLIKSAVAMMSCGLSLVGSHRLREFVLDGVQMDYQISTCILYGLSGLLLVGGLALNFDSVL